MRDYYDRHFRRDLLSFLPRQDVPYFGHSWHVDCAGLEKVHPDHRAQFLVCLYFTVLVDQAVHEHYPHLHTQFEQLTRYPKFCHGLGQFQKNPREILDTPVERGFVSAALMAEAIPAGMQLFVDEVVDFATTHMPELKPSEFFEHLLCDPDVQIPLIVVMADPKLKECPAWKAYESLRLAVATKFPESQR